MSYDYHRYMIDNVYGTVSPGLREEIVDLWLRNRVLLSREMAERRVDQVVLAIRNPAKQIAGVSTVYVGNFQGPGDRYYFYRMFIQPGDRIPGMMRFVTLRTRQILQERHKPGGPKGIIIVTENVKLMRPGIRGMLKRIGYEYLDRDRHGHDVWRALF